MTPAEEAQDRFEREADDEWWEAVCAMAAAGLLGGDDA